MWSSMGGAASRFPLPGALEGSETKRVSQFRPSEGWLDMNRNDLRRRLDEERANRERLFSVLENLRARAHVDKTNEGLETRVGDINRAVEKADGHILELEPDWRDRPADALMAAVARFDETMKHEADSLGIRASMAEGMERLIYELYRRRDQRRYRAARVALEVMESWIEHVAASTAPDN
jgi:hypothetical protein